MSESPSPVRTLQKVKMRSDLHLKIKNQAKNSLIDKRNTANTEPNSAVKKSFCVEITGIQMRAELSKRHHMIRGNTNFSILSPAKPFRKLQKSSPLSSLTQGVTKKSLNFQQINKKQKTEMTVNTGKSPQKNQGSVKQIKNQKLGLKLKTLPKLDLEPQKSTVKINKVDRPLFSSLQLELKKIKSQHYYVIQKQSKQALIAYRSRTKIQVASLTKILTFYTIYNICEEFSIDLSHKKYEVHEEIVEFPGTTANLQDGYSYTIQQLLYGMMLPSGNDAAMALAYWGGSILNTNKKQSGSKYKIFMSRMNQTAKDLGMNDSYFGNPHGLPHKDSRTTCEDMALLCSVCLDIPLFRKIVSTKLYHYKVCDPSTKRKFTLTWENTHKLLRRPGFIGIKTGITVTAGPCLATAYLFKGKTYIVILAKCNKLSRRFKETRKLLTYCLRKIPYEEPLSSSENSILQKLNRSNQQLDSDYSDEEHEFNFSSFGANEIERRKRIITQS